MQTTVRNKNTSAISLRTPEVEQCFVQSRGALQKEVAVKVLAQ